MRADYISRVVWRSFPSPRYYAGDEVRAYRCDNSTTPILYPAVKTIAHKMDYVFSTNVIPLHGRAV